MPLSEELSAEVSRLKERLGDFERACDPRDDEAAEEEGYDHTRRSDETLLSVLRDTCTLVRKAEASNSVHLTELVEVAQALLAEGVYFAYEDEVGINFLPSYAHDNERGEPLIEDRGKMNHPSFCK